MSLGDGLCRLRARFIQPWVDLVLREVIQNSRGPSFVRPFGLTRVINRYRVSSISQIRETTRSSNFDLYRVLWSQVERDEELFDVSTRGLFSRFRYIYLNYFRIIVGSGLVGFQDGTWFVFNFNCPALSRFKDVYSTSSRATTRFVGTKELSGGQGHPFAVVFLSIATACSVCVRRGVLSNDGLFFCLYFRDTMRPINVCFLMFRRFVIYGTLARFVKERRGVFCSVLFISPKKAANN